MQAYLPRTFQAPVRDEEAESQRKARSRQARQTRRSTQEGNVESRLEAQTESPAAATEEDSSSTPARGLSSIPDASVMNSRVAGLLPQSELPERVEGDVTRARKALSDSPPASPSPTAKSFRHDRLSRLDSGGGAGDAATDKPLGRMYETALQENEQLKSRLRDSKQELAKIRSQLEKVTQKQDRMSERSSVLESDKREKKALEKRVSDMEEE
ncbi:hypothetical protein CRUP_037296, partial [Coryphaenoides rupestris]